MKTIAMPAALHEVFGEKQTLGSLVGVLLAGSVGAAAFYFLGADTLITAGILRTSLALLLAFDIAAGCAANFTRGTSDFYARRTAKRWIFIAVHVHLPALALLAGLPFYPSLAAWALSISAASIVNARAGKADQPALAGLLLALGAPALYLMPMPEAQRLISLLFFIKLAYAFAVDHYRAAISAAPVAKAGTGTAEDRSTLATAPEGKARSFELRMLGPADKKDFITVMADAFTLDPSFSYFFGKTDRDRAAGHFLSFLFDLARIKGDELCGAFQDGRLAACSIVEHAMQLGLRSSLAFIRIALRAVVVSVQLPRGSFARLQRYMAVARATLPEGRWRYLVMIGARTESRGKGLGAALLDKAIAEAEADTLCAGLALDTENERNLPLYEGRGFKLLASHTLEGTIVFSMARPCARNLV